MKHADRKPKRKHEGKLKKRKLKHSADRQTLDEYEQERQNDGKRKPKQESNLRTRTQSLPNS